MKVQLLVLFYLFSAKAFGQTIFSENMGVPVTDTSIASYNLGTAPATFQNKGTLMYTGNAVVSKDTPSTTYAASAGGNVLLTNDLSQYFTIYNIDNRGLTGQKLTFGLSSSNSGTITQADFTVEYATDYDALANEGTFLPLNFSITQNQNNLWGLVTIASFPKISATLAIRFRQISTANQIRIDDVTLSGTSAVTSTAATLITKTTATLHGKVGAAATDPAGTEKGFIYAKQTDNPAPTVGGSNVIKTSVEGTPSLNESFILQVTGLSPATTYVYRAYVYNGVDYYYSAITTLTTLAQATKLAFRANLQPVGSVATDLNNFVVDALKPDGTIDTDFNGTVTLTATPSVPLSGGLSLNAVKGVVSFTGIKIPTAGTYVINASTPSLTSGNSSSIIIHSLPINNTCSAPTILSINNPATNGYLYGARVEQPFGGYGDVWYQFTVAQNGDHTIAVDGFIGSVFFDLYEEKCLIAGNTVTTGRLGQAITASAKPQILTMNLASGTYRIRVYGGENIGQSSDFTIGVSAAVITTTWNGASWDHGTPTAAMKAVLHGNYTTAGNLVSKTLTINTDKTLTIAANTSFTTGNFDNSGSLVVESDANFVQTAGSINTGTGTSTINRDARMKRLDYTYWGSPVAGQKLKAFSPETLNTRFLSYNTAADNFDAVPNPANTNFTPGKGYAIRASNLYPVWEIAANAIYTVFQGAFIGYPNNGDVPVSLSLDGQRFNLVGNPYPSNINLVGDNGLFTLNNGLTDGSAYFWTNVNQYANPKEGEAYNGDNYAVFNLAGGKAAENSSVKPTGVVKVGQGFIVKAEKSGDLVFKNAMREAMNSGVFFRESNPKDRFWLKVTTPDKDFNTLLIAYIPNATDGIDLNYDAPVLSISSNAFYSILDDNKLSIQGRQYPLNTSDMVPLGSNHYVAGNYIISLQETEGIFANGQNVYLKDGQTGKINNLSEGDYTFAANAGLTEGRFEIVYKSDLVLGTANGIKDQLVVYRDGDDFVVKSQNKNISSVDVYDSSGRLVLKTNPNHAEVRIDASTVIKGVYVLKINRNGELSTKKMIK